MAYFKTQTQTFIGGPGGTLPQAWSYADTVNTHLLFDFEVNNILSCSLVLSQINMDLRMEAEAYIPSPSQPPWPAPPLPPVLVDIIYGINYEQLGYRLNPEINTMPDGLRRRVLAKMTFWCSESSKIQAILEKLIIEVTCIAWCE